MARQMNRRVFLRNVASGAAGVVILPRAASARSYRANEKVNVALVGIGGRGRWFVGCMPGMATVVAVCDVNDRRAAESLKKMPGTPRFYDFRKMLDEKGKEIDGVVVATPDHTHAAASFAAMQAGKGVLCEKPLTRTVWEARLLRETAGKRKVATQMGNQGTASRALRDHLSYIRAGVIGEVREVHVWKDSGGPGKPAAPSGSEPVPDGLKWDLWLGPAAGRDFHSDWLRWHDWRDFATGYLGNWSPHSSNLPFMALKVHELWYADPATKPRLKVSAKVSAINKVSFPKWEVVRWEIPARGELPAVTWTWHNGRESPDSRDLIEAKIGEGLDWGDKKEKKWHDHAGCILLGSKGRIFGNGHNTVCKLLPIEKFAQPPEVPAALPASPGHEREWLNAIAGGPKAVSNFDYAGPLVEFLMLGNVATQVEGPIEYDPLAGRIVNHEQADQLLRFPPRKGWLA